MSSTYRNVPGFTPFKASQSGNSLVSGDGQQVTVRTMVDQDGNEYTLITKWRRNRGATQIALDDLDRPLKYRFHAEREGDAFEALVAALAEDRIFLHDKVA